MLADCIDLPLLNALKQGDLSAFDGIYAQYSKSIYLFLLDKLKDPDVCSDVLQDIFIVLWERRETIEISTSLKAYLYQAARYKIIDLYRREARYQRYLSELGDFIVYNQPDIADHLHHRIRLQEVNKAINNLPLRMKEIFILSRFEHQSVKEIAEKLNLSTQTIKNQLTKALATLRTYHLVLLSLLLFKHP